MQIVKKYPNGIFNGVSLTTTDLAGAQAFYTGLFGWDVGDQSMPSDGYIHFRIDGYSVTEAVQMMPDMLDAGAPPAWTSHVNVEDADANAARAAEAGGVVLMPPMDLMDEGRMALIQDPTGAPLGIWQPGTKIGAQVVNQPNSLVWNELQTNDVAKTQAFYSDVFGWTSETSESGYVAYYQDGRLHCGSIAIGEDWGDVSPNWLVYFLVDDLDAAAARAAELGGEIVKGPSSSPTMGRMAVVRDPQGAIFAIINFGMPADPPPGTEE